MKNDNSDNLIQNKSLEFSFASINLINKLPNNRINQVLVKQYLRSSTSIGANIEESLGAHTRSDFIYSMNVAKKEARESLYWLKLILKINLSNKSEIERLGYECKSIINILTKIVKTSKK